MERGLDRASQQYRQTRILLIAFMTEKSYEDAETLADRWLVNAVTVAIGDDPEEIRFIPHPIWDDEWMLHRKAFKTREEALAHVAAEGGTLLVSGT